MKMERRRPGPPMRSPSASEVAKAAPRSPAGSPYLTSANMSVDNNRHRQHIELAVEVGDVTKYDNVTRAVRAFDRVSKMLASFEGLFDSSSMGKAEIVVLATAAHAPNSTMSRLAESSGVRLSTATKIVDRLVEKGLAERTRNGGDRRIVRVRLTTAGAEMMAAYQNHMRSAVTLMLSALTPTEQEAFIDMWEKIADAADTR